MPHSGFFAGEPPFKQHALQTMRALKKHDYWHCDMVVLTIQEKSAYGGRRGGDIASHPSPRMSASGHIYTMVRKFVVYYPDFSYISPASIFLVVMRC